MSAPVSRDDLARELLAYSVLSDWVKAEVQRLRDQMAAQMVPGARQEGLLTPGDKESLLGFVTLVKGRQSWRVTDAEALLDWCKRMAPGEVVTVQSVRSSFINALLAECKAHGGWISPEGELTHPDGVDVSVGDPYVQVKAVAEADSLVAEALRTRRLELTPGGGA